MRLGPSPLLKTGGLFFGPRGSRALASLRGAKGLALDYIDNSYADRDMTLALGKATDLLTFSRSSAATYFDRNGIQRTAGPDVLRLTHDPVTGESLGALLEGRATNLVPYPADFSLWTGSSDVSRTVAGDGWWLLNKTIAGSKFISALCGTLVVDTTYSTTIELMAGADSNSATIGLYSTTAGNWGTYAASTARILSGPGTLSGTSGAWRTVSGLSTTVPTKIEITRTYASGDAGNVGLYVYPVDINSSAAAGSILARYPQVEAGPFGTSYIPTNSTRFADNLSFARAGTPEGTVVIRGRTAPGVGSSDQCIWQWDDGTRTSRYILVRNPGRSLRFYAQNAGAQAIAPIALGTVADDTDFVAAVSFKATLAGGSLNGAPAVTAVPVGALPTVSTMRLGSDINVYPWKGTIASVCQIPKFYDPSLLPGMLS